MLEIGKCYHIDFLPKWDGSCEEALIQVVKIRSSEFDIVHLACTETLWAERSFMTLKTINVLQGRGRVYEVTNIKDLPLYLGWTYTSPELSLMIKQGTLEAVCK
jgi:hypothetical protein